MPLSSASRVCLPGTLLDTEALATESMQATVDVFGKTMTWDIKKNFLGLRPSEWAPMLIQSESRRCGGFPARGRAWGRGVLSTVPYSLLANCLFGHWRSTGLFVDGYGVWAADGSEKYDAWVS